MPASILNQIVIMLSPFIDTAIIDMPSGIVTAGFMEKLNSKNKDK